MAIFLHAQHGAARRAPLQQRAKDDRPHFLKVYTSQLDMNNSNRTVRDTCVCVQDGLQRHRGESCVISTISRPGRRSSG